MKLWWFVPPMLVLAGCRTSFYDISYDRVKVGKLQTEEVHEGDSYYRIESMDGIEIRWFPEVPVLNNLMFWR